MKYTDDTIIIDCGHGGLLNGVYTTGNKKMHKFENGEIAYEGVINRMFGRIINEKLIQNGFKTKYTVHPNDPSDVKLFKRVRFANNIDGDSLFLSIHCNAFNTEARGSEVWTSIGKTESDLVAQFILESLSDYTDMKMRYDQSDGDLDKESQFYVLRNTNMKAVLLEMLFFDNYEDFSLTKDECEVEKICDAVVNGIIAYYDFKNNT